MGLRITQAVQSQLNQKSTDVEWAQHMVDVFGPGCKLVWYEGSTPRVTLTFQGFPVAVGGTVEIGPTYVAQSQSAGTPTRTVLETADGSATAEFSEMLPLSGTPGDGKGFTLDGPVVLNPPPQLTSAAAPIVLPASSMVLESPAPMVPNAVDPDPEWETVPTITFVLGSAEDVDVTGAFLNAPDGTTYAHTSGSLPTGVTFSNGTYSYNGGGSAGGTDGHVVTATTPTGVIAVPPAAMTLSGKTPSLNATGTPSSLPTFGVISSAGGSNQPFTFGHVFGQGDVPSGFWIDSDLTDWQAIPTTYWPDGSVRHAIISGRSTNTTDVATTITLSTTETDPGGTALTQSDLSSVLSGLGATNIVAGSETITLSSLVSTGAKHRTVCEGPVMSNWIYRKQLTGSNHIVVWFDVRLYMDDSIEIFPWVENGYLTVASPAADTRTYTFNFNGSQRFSASIEMKHHTRVALLNNTSSDYKHWSYWSGIDPEIEPLHDTDYLISTKMVPNYVGVPNADALAGTGVGPTDGFTQSYQPNWIGNTDAAMGAPGYGGHIGILPAWCATYCASGDRRPYRAVIANGVAAGSWPMHYRDQGTNEWLRFSDWPNVSWAWSGNPTIPVGTGGTNSNAAPDRAHQPSIGFLPWLLTGRWYHLDTTLAWLTWSYLWESNYVTRNGADFLVTKDGQERGRAWVLRTMAHVLAILPDDHPCYPDVKASWEANMAAHKSRYVDGTEDGGAHQNSLGWMGTYSSKSGNNSPYKEGAGGYWWGAAWMQYIYSMALGIAWDMDVPQSATSKANHQIVRDFAYSLPIQIAGPGTAGTFNYRRLPLYAFPIGEDNLGVPPETWFTNFEDIYDVVEAYAGGGDGAEAAPLQSLPGGNTIYYGDTLITSDTWARSTPTAFFTPAIAMAVDHGATGASEAWARITGSDSYALAATGWASYQLWGITPRSA